MFYRKFNLLFQDIIVVGCGGTGSRIIPPLVQTIKQAQAQINPCLYLIDGDIVEHKNLSRQNFIQRDVGRNKAVVLAERYGAALDFPIVAHSEYVNTGFLTNILYASAAEQDKRAPTNLRKLIIMCVDSIDARLKILAAAGREDVIIDAGNEDTFGQVSIFDRVSLPHLGGVDLPVDIKPFNGEYEIPFIPAPIQAYLEAMVNPPKATGSCADLDQSLAVNFMMAAGIINKVQNLAYNNPFYCRTNYFDLIKGNSSERMTIPWFNQVMSEEVVHENERISNWSNDWANIKYRIQDRDKITRDIVTDINEKVTFIDPRLLAALGK